MVCQVDAQLAARSALTSRDMPIMPLETISPISCSRRDIYRRFLHSRLPLRVYSSQISQLRAVIHGPSQSKVGEDPICSRTVLAWKSLSTSTLPFHKCRFNHHHILCRATDPCASPLARDAFHRRCRIGSSQPSFIRNELRQRRSHLLE